MEALLGGAVLSIPFIIHYLEHKYYPWERGSLRYLEHVKNKGSTEMLIPLPIHVIKSTEEMDKICNEILEECHRNRGYFMGVDAEWKPNQIKGEQPHPVAILQIATPKAIYLFQLLYLSNGIPESLCHVMSNRNIIKAGVGVLSDAKKLLRDHGIQLRGCVELAGIVENIAPSKPERMGLKQLTTFYTELSLPKEKRIQLSDWSVKELSDAQIHYAAADAWGGLLVLEQLVFYFLREKERPLNYWWKNSTSLLPILTWLHPHVDKLPPRKNDKSSSKGTDSKQKQMKPPSEKYEESASRKTPLYDGCQMLDPDGNHVAYCNKDKVQWYLSKGIADLIPNTEPAVIMLKFFPSGTVGSESRASETQIPSAESANRCVICGSSINYQKFYVVPKSYRQFFPHTAKFHCSHDIVLLCSTCHYTCSHRVEEHKSTVIAEKYGVPVLGLGQRYNINQEGALVAAAGRQLRKNTKKMTQEQIDERKELIKKYFNCDSVTNDILIKCSKIEYKIENPDYKSHGEAIVEQLVNNPEELQKFIVSWRRFFMDEFNPQYLPNYWNPNHEWEEEHGSGKRVTGYY